MADATGVQVFIGPANQLELGDVVTGPPSVTLETVDASHQRLHFSIPAPTQELVDAADGAQSAAAAAATSAAAAQASAATAAVDAATEAVRATLLPSNLALDTDGVPFISPGSNTVFVFADTDGRPYFVS
jgi:hypothetical protein